MGFRFNEAHPKIVIKRMTRAMFGVTSSPILLGGTLLLELIRKHEPHATNITNTEESQEESSYAEIRNYQQQSVVLLR